MRLDTRLDTGRDICIPRVHVIPDTFVRKYTSRKRLDIPRILPRATIFAHSLFICISHSFLKRETRRANVPRKMYKMLSVGRESLVAERFLRRFFLAQRPIRDEILRKKTEIHRHSLQTSAEPRGCKINTLLFVAAAVAAKSPTPPPSRCSSYKKNNGFASA